MTEGVKPPLGFESLFGRAASPLMGDFIRDAARRTLGVLTKVYLMLLLVDCERLLCVESCRGNPSHTTIYLVDTEPQVYCRGSIDQSYILNGLFFHLHHPSWVNGFQWQVIKLYLI